MPPLPIDQEVALFARIVDDAPMGVVILTPGRTIRYVNNCAARILKSDRRTLLGSYMDRIVVDREGWPTWLELWNAAVDGKAGEAKVVIAPQEGEEIACFLTALNLDDGGRHQGVALIFRDMTNETRIAEQIEKKNIEMAKMNAELIRSNVDLKRLSDMKSNFLSIASHELKTPLTSIKGYSDIIIDAMRDRIDDGIYRMIQSINRAADRLHRVIENILDVTRIEQKKLRLRPEEFDLCLAARDCIDDLVQMAEKRRITFSAVSRRTFRPSTRPRPHAAGIHQSVYKCNQILARRFDDRRFNYRRDAGAHSHRREGPASGSTRRSTSTSSIRSTK